MSRYRVLEMIASIRNPLLVSLGLAGWIWCCESAFCGQRSRTADGPDEARPSIEKPGPKIALNAGAATPLPMLVEHGRSDYAIVIPDKPAQAEAWVAEQLQEYLTKIAGAKLPIHTDIRQVGERIISVGHTRYAGSSRMPSA